MSIREICDMFGGQVVERDESFHRGDTPLEGEDYLVSMLTGVTSGLTMGSIASLSKRSGLSWSTLLQSAKNLIAKKRLNEMVVGNETRWVLLWRHSPKKGNGAFPLVRDEMGEL